MLTEVAMDVSTPIGVYVQLRGSAATIASGECVVTRGGISVFPSATISTAGEVSATLTTAHLATLGAGIGDVLTIWWEGTVSDGGTTVTWRFEEEAGVSDRVLRIPLDYNRLTARITTIGKSCAVPTGQSNFWPQVRIALADLRDDINSQQATVKTYCLAREGTLRQIAEAYALCVILPVMVNQVSGQTAILAKMWEIWEKKKASLWANLILVSKDTSAWQTESGKSEHLAKPPATAAGRAVGIGGAL